MKVTYGTRSIWPPGRKETKDLDIKNKMIFDLWGVLNISLGKLGKSRPSLACTHSGPPFPAVVLKSELQSTAGRTLPPLCGTPWGRAALAHEAHWRKKKLSSSNSNHWGS